MISCVSIGPGDPDLLTRQGFERIAQAEVVAGFAAVLDLMGSVVPASASQLVLTYANQEEQLAVLAARHQRGERCVLLAMGDVHFSGFQLLERLERACGHRAETIPGISAAQVLASKARVCFDETTFITLHRPGVIEPFEHHLDSALRDGRNAIVIPRPWDRMPQHIARQLLARGRSPDHPVEVWEHLTGDEGCWTGTLATCTAEFSDMSIMLIRTLAPVPSGV